MSRVIDALRPTFGVEPVCRALEVPVSTYYARRNRRPSARELADRELVRQIHAARQGHRAAYGVRKTWQELRRRGVDCGRDHTGRLMRAEGLAGICRGRRPRTTVPSPRRPDTADLVRRRFAAERPNALWVADITYVGLIGGFCYLAFILDVFSRRIVGWQMACHLRAKLVVDALEMAVCLRRPGPGLIAHSDRGSQYTSLAYSGRLEQLGMAPSLGSRGDALDNAMAEAFVASYKSECVRGRRFESAAQAAHETLSWIGFYNHERLHGRLGDLPPQEFEAIHAAREHADALSGDLRPAPQAARVLIPPAPGPFGAADPVQPALWESAGRGRNSVAETREASPDARQGSPQ